MIRLRHRNQARCTCGWIGKASLLLSSAKVDALLHAARDDCEPAIPLFQPGAVVPIKPPGVPIKPPGVLKANNPADPKLEG